MAEVARSFLGLRAKAVLYPHHLGGSCEVLERVERQRGGACEQEVNETDLCGWSFGEFFRYTCGEAHRRLDHG